MDFDISFMNNDLEHWAIAIAITLASTVAMHWTRQFILHRMEQRAARTATMADDLVAKMLRKTYIVIMLALSAHLGGMALDLTARQRTVSSHAAIVALILQLAIWGDTLLRAWRDHTRVGDGRKASRTIVCFLLRLTLWVVAFLMVLDNFGFNITALVASLGIGGIAVALAVQNILGDLFASLSIMLDKPFEIGDFIIVGDVLGSVEHIGLKTTRLRGLGGEQVIFSNGDLLKSRIHNHKRMESRRVAFILRVAYGASESQLARVPVMIREVVESQGSVAFERAHFFNYGEWSLDFEVVYHFQSPDYIAHMDTQQAILLEIYRRFERERIRFAHPLSIVRLADTEGDAAMPARTYAPSPAASYRG
ncbi:mechanosensitive ion channel family protein [Massilia sp. Dwa41.01b]|uniref:mechanosensitive ion channel family protein n=1 Tax=unclassified Massilia TaxID=2609279 RepID=UPI0016015165|nr:MULTISPECIES: mechanosensitive ion channel family protein [unclassified Massilia]QNA89094.1 mechanosensitive ion channel family protein [Massilia sp. Dwa41.01b]QNA99985.1 mechanosensitive ion channel family protein [Massilia sp. Se16.2.3]